MPPELITGRDVELIGGGILCLMAAGYWGIEPDGSLALRPLILFIFLSGFSFVVAWWDIRTRGSLSIWSNDD